MADFTVRDLDHLDWTEQALAPSLGKVFAYTLRQGRDASAWYYSHRAKKMWLGRCTRIAAMLSVGAAALLPLIAEINAKDGKTLFSPAWASVLLGVAALFVAFDRFWGGTSGWVRYVLVGQQIDRCVESFRIEWSAFLIDAGAMTTKDQAKNGLQICGAFTARVQSLVAEETAQWATDFNAALKQIDDSLAARSEPARTGAVNVRISNGELTQSGWQLAVDNGTPVNGQGKSCALTELIPGTHQVRVTAAINNKTVAAEESFAVIAGQVTTIELMLA